MKQIMNIVELIGKIKTAKKNLDDIFSTYIDQDVETRSMVSIYNPNNNVTINGQDKQDAVDRITTTNKLVNDAFNTFSKLMFIKEEVNAKSKLKVPSPYDCGESTITMSIAQILVMKSDKIKKYKLDYIDRLITDYNDGLTATVKHRENALNQEKIDRYVLAKLNSLNIKVDKSSNIYEEFANEYRNANKMVLLDPLNIADITRYKPRIMEFYEKIDNILLTYNATTKIWIDLDSKSDLWGFCD